MNSQNDHIVVYHSEADRAIDQFIWHHPEYLLVPVVALVIGVLLTLLIIHFSTPKWRRGL